jgi:hypothetical protein
LDIDNVSDELYREKWPHNTMPWGRSRAALTRPHDVAANSSRSCDMHILPCHRRSASPKRPRTISEASSQVLAIKRESRSITLNSAKINEACLDREPGWYWRTSEGQAYIKAVDGTADLDDPELGWQREED